MNKTKRSQIEPRSLAHQKLISSGIGCAELARVTGASKPSALEWIRKGSKPRQQYQDAIRARLGIQWADWDRKPAPPDPITPEEQEAATSVELVRKDDARESTNDDDPGEPDPPLGQELEYTLREVRKSRREAQSKGISTAAAQLLAQESALVKRLSEQRDQQQTERDRVMACPLVQGMYRVAVDVLRPAMGDDWSAAVDRIVALWDQLDEEGRLPKGSLEEDRS
jgi:hypothetical protein